MEPQKHTKKVGRPCGDRKTHTSQKVPFHVGETVEPITTKLIDPSLWCSSIIVSIKENTVVLQNGLEVRKDQIRRLPGDNGRALKRIIENERKNVSNTSGICTGGRYGSTKLPF